MSDLGLDRLMSVADAIALLDATPVPVLGAAAPPPARPTLDADATADRDYPPFDKSLVDGYAVRAADVPVAGATLMCVGEVAAGHPWTDGPIPAGACVAIMTGAPLPPGVDAVVPVEETTVVADDVPGLSFVAFARPAKPGRSIARRGSDAPAGATVLRAGTAVGPAQVAVLAQLGTRPRQLEDMLSLKPTPAGSDPSVDPLRASTIRPRRGRLERDEPNPPHAPLRAHVLTTGDEVVPHDAPLPNPDAIRDSNGPMLVALLASIGVAATRSHVGDDADAVRDAIDRLTRDGTPLFVTGGMSMGRHDHVPATLRGLGFDLAITKLRMKPGKPFVFAFRGARGEGRKGGARGEGRGARKDDKADAPLASSLAPRPSPLAPSAIVFGLPGNPVSAFCCTLRLAARVIRRMQGLPPGDDLRDATLAAALPANGPREFYQPATLDALGRATPLEWKGSADVFTLARADALIVRPADEPARAVGEAVRVLPIPR